jgi:hypothetical protein
VGGGRTFEAYRNEIFSELSGRIEALATPDYNAGKETEETAEIDRKIRAGVDEILAAYEDKFTADELSRIKTECLAAV